MKDKDIPSAPRGYEIQITEGDFREMEWHAVTLFRGDEPVSQRRVYGFFRPSRARRLGKKMLRDARNGIYWEST
jgi:hypothetical protein